MATQESTMRRHSSGLITFFLTLIFLASLAAFIWTIVQDKLGVNMPTIIIATATTTGAQQPAIPTRGMVISIPRTQPDRPVVRSTPMPGVAQNEATATARYNEAIQQSQNGAVVLPENDHQPVQLIQVEVERMPAGDNVPTSEPLAAPSGVDPVNVQETHECKHGQIWTDSGCKNPPSDSSVFGSKSRP